MSNITDEDGFRISMYAHADNVEEWDDEAEELGMSRSEYIRSMVHAGRRQIAQLDPKTDQGDADLKEQVLAQIPEDDATSPDQIVENVLNPVEDKIREEILPELDKNGEIRYDPVKEGYTQI